MDKSDGFVKTPLFGLSLFLPLKIFGTSLSVGRLTVLLISLFLCGYIFSRNAYYGALGLVSVILVLAEYHIFHYFHYCMAELLCTSLIFTGKNAFSWQQSVKNRTFTIKAANNYLAGYDFKDNPVMGSWAPSLSWKCKAMTYPIWKNYFNDKDVLNAFHPAVIIAEHDEEDSNQAYSLQGIDLSACSDSVKTFFVNHWTLKIYWIRQNAK